MGRTPRLLVMDTWLMLRVRDMRQSDYMSLIQERHLLERAALRYYRVTVRGLARIPTRI